MTNSELELNTFSLEEQEKIASSVEDIYGYQVLTEEFEERINRYNVAKEQEQQKYVDYVFSQTNDDDIMIAFQHVMEANTNTIVGVEYTTEKNSGDSPVFVASFTFLGALIAGMIRIVIDKQKKRKEIT